MGTMARRWHHTTTARMVLRHTGLPLPRPGPFHSTAQGERLYRKINAGNVCLSGEEKTKTKTKVQTEGGPEDSLPCVVSCKKGKAEGNVVGATQKRPQSQSSEHASHHSGGLLKNGDESAILLPQLLGCLCLWRGEKTKLFPRTKVSQMALGTVPTTTNLAPAQKKGGEQCPAGAGRACLVGPEPSSPPLPGLGHIP